MLRPSLGGSVSEPSRIHLTAGRPINRSPSAEVGTTSSSWPQDTARSGTCTGKYRQDVPTSCEESSGDTASANTCTGVPISRGHVALAQVLLDASQFAAACALNRLGNLILGFGSRRAPAGAKGEGVDLGKADLSHDTASRFEILLRLTGKPHDHVGGKRRLRELLRDQGTAINKAFGTPAAVSSAGGCDPNRSADRCGDAGRPGEVVRPSRRSARESPP